MLIIIMDELRKTHLSNLLSLFNQKKVKQKGEDIIQHALSLELNRIKNATGTEDPRKNINSMCTHCFTRWKEGQFSVKFRPKNRSKWNVGRNFSKRMVVRCSFCSHAEYVTFTRLNQIQVNNEKNKKVSSDKKMKFNHSVGKPKDVLNAKSKRKLNKTPVVKKSNLTILKDLL